MGQRLLPLLILMAASSLTVGCSRQPAQQTVEEKSRANIGADMQRNGVMSQPEYVRLRGVIDDIRRDGAISDTDLGWSLALLHKSSQAITHTRVMTGLSILKRCSASQKAKISKAISPFLNSREPLDRAGARRLQRTIQRL